MIERAAGLSPRALAAIAQLQHEVVAVDGGRLKLEWGSLRTRSGERVDDLLWWEAGRLLGFLGLYSGATISASSIGDPNVAGARSARQAALRTDADDHRRARWLARRHAPRQP